MSPQDDSSLSRRVAAIAAYDEWLTAVYDKYAARLYGYALVTLRNREDAEDAVQQLFTKLVELNAVPQQPEHYLFRAIHNICQNRLRRPVVEQPGSFHQALMPIAGSLSAERDLAIARALESLPPIQRLVVYLHAFEGRTFREIEAISDISRTRADRLYQEARNRLHASLFGV